MARAKRTDRAEARRRHRAEQAALAATETERAEQDAVAAPAPSAAPRRGFGIRPPDFRTDLAAVPSILRTRRLMYLPLVLVAVGFVVGAFTSPPAKGAQPNSAQTIEQLIVELTIAQPSLLYFIQGFVAPRGAYLFGAVLGVVDGILLAVLYVAGLGWFTGSNVPTTADTLWQIVGMIITQVVLGAIFAWFAAWYRDFLRRTQTRSREAADARKKEQRRQARRAEARPRAR